MIKMLRIDDRLLHGQVAFVWSKQLAVDGIVVVNDDVVNDSIQSMSIKMAAPSGIKLAVRTINDAIKLLNNPKGKNMKIFTVVKNPKDAYRIIQGLNNLNDIELINLGNYGRMNKDKDEKKVFTKAIYASEEDLQYFKKIVDTGLEFEIRMVPTDTRKYVKDLL